MKHPIPLEILEDHVAVLAKTGKGKTYMAKGLVERLLREKRRVCIVDPKNAWWGLKSSADGKSPAFAISIFGGPNADMPLLAAHGKVLGEAVATTDMPCVICTKGMTEADRIRFLTDFFQTLDMKNVEPLHLVLDEAHMMAPQKPLGEMQRLTHYTAELVSGGRGMGFRIILLSQRPARLNKDVLTQCETLVAMGMTGPQDRDAVKAWIHDQADSDTGREIIASLPGLPKGEGWLWSPARNILERVKFPPISTYDNSRTQKDGAADKRAQLAPVDLTALQAKLGKAKQEIDANDPKALRARITELEKQIKAAPVAPTVLDKEALTKARERGYSEGVAATLKDIAKQDAAHEKSLQALSVTLAKVKSLIPDTVPLPQRNALQPPQLPAANFSKPPVSETRHSPVSKTTANPNLADGVTRPQQKILDALAWWAAAGHEHPTREQVAGVAGYSPSSGGFNNLIGSTNSAGWTSVPAPGLVALTDAGRALANTQDAPTTEELHRRVQAVLTNPQWKIMRALLMAHPDQMSREKLGEETGYSASSGGFNNLLGSLSTLRMITKPAPGSVRAADWLFVG